MCTISRCASLWQGDASVPWEWVVWQIAFNEVIYFNPFDERLINNIEKKSLARHPR